MVSYFLPLKCLCGIEYFAFHLVCEVKPPEFKLINTSITSPERVAKYNNSINNSLEYSL